MRRIGKMVGKETRKEEERVCNKEKNEKEMGRGQEKRKRVCYKGKNERGMG